MRLTKLPWIAVIGLAIAIAAGGCALLLIVFGVFGGID